MRGFAWMLVGGSVLAGAWLVGTVAASLAAPLGANASAAGLAAGVGLCLVLPLALSRRLVKALADRTPRRGPIHGTTLFVANAAAVGLLVGATPDRARAAIEQAGDWPLFGQDVPVLSDALAARHIGTPHVEPVEEPVEPEPEVPGVSEVELAPLPEPMEAASVFAAAADSVVVIEMSAPADGPLASFMPTLHGHGSGFAVGPDLVVSNFHVAGEATALAVRTRDGRRLPAARIAELPGDDLVLLQVDGLDLAPLTLAESGAIHIGATTWAIGAPLGLEYSLTEGILSGRRDVSGTPFLQMQTTVAPGSSGGPLLDNFAHVVGVNTAVASPGLSLAVDVARVDALLALERDGEAEALPLLPKPIRLVKADLPSDLMPTERMRVEQLLETLTAALSAQVTLEAESGRLDLSPKGCAQEGMVADCATLRRELGFRSSMLRMLPDELHATYAEVPTADGGTGTLELGLHPRGLPSTH